MSLSAAVAAKSQPMGKVDLQIGQLTFPPGSAGVCYNSDVWMPLVLAALPADGIIGPKSLALAIRFSLCALSCREGKSVRGS